MKALITAGGQGTRLRPLSSIRNKHLLPVANRPIMFYVLDMIARAGITDVAIAINPGDNEIKNAVGDGKLFGLNVAYIEVSAPLGLPQIIQSGADFVGSDSFVFYLGDNLLQEGIQRFVKDFIAKGEPDCYLVLAQVDSPERYGVVEIKNDNVISIKEKPQEHGYGYSVTGIYIYNSRILQVIRKLVRGTSAEMTISAMHQYLLDNSFRIAYSEIVGWWKDVGTPTDLLEVNQLVLEELSPFIDGQVDVRSTIVGPVIIQRGAHIVTSTIYGPAIIGEDCVIERCIIASYVAVGRNCQVHGSTIENSVVLENTVIETPTKIMNSIVGEDVYISLATQ